MIKKVYDKGGCVGCPPYMGCLGESCPHCYEYILVCDDCGKEVDGLYQGSDGFFYCDDCIKNNLEHISYDDDLEKLI